MLRILPRAGEAGEKTSCVSSLTGALILVDVVEFDTAVSLFDEGEGVLRRERFSGLTICAGEGSDLAWLPSCASTGGVGVRFLTTRLPLCGEGGPKEQQVSVTPKVKFRNLCSYLDIAWHAHYYCRTQRGLQHIRYLL